MFGNDCASFFMISLTLSAVMVSSEKLWVFAESPTEFPPGGYVGHTQPLKDFLSWISLHFSLKKHDWICTISIALMDYSASRHGKHNHWYKSVSTKYIEHVE